MPQIRLMLLWHMHQPYYKDLVDNRYIMPWVRLHTLKDYYGMVAILRDFPRVHVTFNLVPSLVSQLLDYATATAPEDSYELALKPAAELNEQDKTGLVHYAFQLNHENLLARYPRFVELFERSKGGGRDPIAALISGVEEIRDLQVFSQLAWFDEIYLNEDREIIRLIQKQRRFTEEDKLTIRDKETEIFKSTLEEYSRAAGRGQIEISTSPFYHPILPLLCDTNIGAESSPGLRLPARRFCHPEDARDQLQAAIKLHQRVFGQRPTGLWPSEGSVSDAALGLAAEEGFQWAATDEGILGRSLQTYFHRHSDGRIQDGNRLYQPYRLSACSRPLTLFFRDHALSDLIGFVYHRVDPRTAAHDLVSKIHSAAANTGGSSAVVSLILDGENAWEYYSGNGREFLKKFYALVEDDPDIRAMTPSEILRDCEPARLSHIAPGSWINANFNVWIGAEEDNRAWDLLSNARNFFASRSKDPSLAPEKIEMARQELWISEGSDWCWWYGPEHSTANDEEFDRLYRQHLGNIYRLLGGKVPDELASPIKRPRRDGKNIAPSALIRPVIDGRETTYFEWLGAGMYIPDARSAAIHEGKQYVEEMSYGSGGKRLYLKLSFRSAFAANQRDFGVRVTLGKENPWRVHLSMSQGTLARVETWRGDGTARTDLKSPGSQFVQAAYGTLLEIGIDLTPLHLTPPTQILFQVSVWVEQLPVQVLPRDGSLALALSGELLTW
jgi:alpha-amylase/alpha-mannosidase (GH57 family)